MTSFEGEELDRTSSASAKKSDGKGLVPDICKQAVEMSGIALSVRLRYDVSDKNVTRTP